MVIFAFENLRMFSNTGLASILFVAMLIAITHCSPLKNQQMASTENQKKHFEQNAKTLQRPRRGYAWHQSPIYQINAPVMLPFWNRPVRYPVYYPAQPIAAPMVNSYFKSYVPPKGYPPPPPAKEPKRKAITIGFDDDYDEDDEMPIIARKPDPADDAPIWDLESDFNPSSTARTTLPTRRHTRTTLPPLVHRLKNGTKSVHKFGNLRPNALRPQPQDHHLIFAAVTKSTTTTSTKRGKPVPSRCTWAIISCCSAASEKINYDCFEQMGCSGAFWDSSPCSKESAQAAIKAASEYYT